MKNSTPIMIIGPRVERPAMGDASSVVDDMRNSPEPVCGQ
jgi:hypothetical protein